MGKVGRNSRCPCGSGKKYKKCCLVSKQKPKAVLEKQMDDNTLNKKNIMN